MFSDRLRQLREDANLTQDELAKKLNLSQSTIAYYENNRYMPTLENAKIIAELFNSSLDYLLGISNTNDNKVSINSELFYDINKLSQRSLEDLKNYIELLKLRDANE